MVVEMHYVPPPPDPAHRIADALERIASCVEDGVLKMRDVDRAKVYSEHLGEKMR